jgi:hypothetical protein
MPPPLIPPPRIPPPRIPPPPLLASTELRMLKLTCLIPSGELVSTVTEGEKNPTAKKTTKNLMPKILNFFMIYFSPFI